MIYSRWYRIPICLCRSLDNNNNLSALRFVFKCPFQVLAYVGEGKHFNVNHKDHKSVMRHNWGIWLWFLSPAPDCPDAHLPSSVHGFWTRTAIWGQFDCFLTTTAVTKQWRKNMRMREEDEDDRKRDAECWSIKLIIFYIKCRFSRSCTSPLLLQRNNYGHHP